MRRPEMKIYIFSKTSPRRPKHRPASRPRTSGPATNRRRSDAAVMPAGMRLRGLAAAGALVLVTALLGAPLSASAATDSPRGVVEDLTGAVMNVLGDKAQSADAKKQRIEDIVYRNVDFDTVAR